MLDIAADRWQAVRKYAHCFDHEHLPGDQPRAVAQQYAATAQALVDMLPDDAWLVAALHDLWESKNAAVLHAVNIDKGRG